MKYQRSRGDAECIVGADARCVGGGLQGIFNDAVAGYLRYRSVDVAHGPQGGRNGLMNSFNDGVTLGVFPGDWDGVDAKVAKDILEGGTDKLCALVEYHLHRSRIPGQPRLLEAVGDIYQALLIATDYLEEVV